MPFPRSPWRQTCTGIKRLNALSSNTFRRLFLPSRTICDAVGGLCYHAGVTKSSTITPRPFLGNDFIFAVTVDQTCLGELVMPHFLLVRRHLPVEHDTMQMDVRLAASGAKPE
jgi:hypothetical protein